KACPRVGFVAAPVHVPKPGELATPISARFTPKPVALTGPDGKPLGGPKMWSIHISFTARVAAGPRSFYFLVQKFPRHGCRYPTYASMSPIARDVHADEQVQTTLYLPTDCHGVVTGEV